MSEQPSPEVVEKDAFERFLDRRFEGPFFALRYVTLIPVVFAYIGAVLMFAIGGYETWHAIEQVLGLHLTASEVQLPLIKAVDAFLLGLVLMIFSYGIYDLFVSKLEPGDRRGVRPNWMKFPNMGALKVTLAEVVIIILVISFFEAVMSNQWTLQSIAVEGGGGQAQPWTLLIIPVGVLLIALGIGAFKKLVHE